MHVTPLRWEGGVLFLLDQRLLPREEIWVACRTANEVAASIATMVVRGAPAIGVAAAYGMALAAERGDDLDDAASTLKRARPTAVNLAWAVDRMLRASRAGADLTREAELIHREDVEANMRIGRHGAQLLGERATVLTHCNAGALATAGYGTALGVIRAAIEGGKHVAVFADETRPYLQGARLTAWELQQDGIDVTLITDNMAGHFFQQNRFDAVIVGADRIAANGDTANKIGTYTVAVLAHAHDVPFYVAAPISTIDPDCPDGTAIPIEERSAQEVVEVFGSRVAPEGIAVRHPAFDVTPARLVSAIITDRGVLRAPYESSIAALFEERVHA
ncbi:MAG: S-methyl-5-thioribose-1-phosphate isomerase [Acidobacteria bacterium]|nr:S-methyl-5-thioribose-1-phosphate isomerase [Acidobacteriota bacterium]MBV9475726.1 S-methyl-5-thioribose-1-phosphate isomerase [Acidobacteriota bacterium]